MTPEIKVFLVAAAVMLFAYTAIYPRLAKKSIFVLGSIDVALTAAILLVVGAVYYGAGIRFSMIFFDVPWWVFAALSAVIVEAPLFVWFCKRWNIDLYPPID